MRGVTRGCDRAHRETEILLGKIGALREVAAIVQPLFLNEDSGHAKKNPGARVFRRAGQPRPENFDVGRCPFVRVGRDGCRAIARLV